MTLDGIFDTNIKNRSRSLRWTVLLLTIVIGVSLIAGIAAALVGGALTDLGLGAGGLFGAPAPLTILIALFLATPAAVVVARQARHSRGWLKAAIAVAGGAWIVAIGYFVIAHAMDPCFNGWLDSTSRIGDQRLCEQFGFELNVDTRFHLLAHAAPATVLLLAYLWAIRRWVTVDEGQEIINESS
jgi:hypothetical protein